MTFLDKADPLLQGKKLVRSRRKGQRRGASLWRVFTRPRSFDGVYWVQGTAAMPSLDDSEKTRPETWQRLQHLYWFN